MDLYAVILVYCFKPLTPLASFHSQPVNCWCCPRSCRNLGTKTCLWTMRYLKRTFCWKIR